MSYNLLSGSVEFVGDQLGLAENLVNTHATQTITGAKTFTNITASLEGDGTVGLTVTGDLNVSNDLSVTGDITGDELTVSEYIKHNGDTDTNIRFQNNRVDITAGNDILLMLDQNGGNIAINNTAGNRNFTLKGPTDDQGLYYSAANRAFQFGSINSIPQDSEALIQITSSYHQYSLLSIGDRKDPIFAVSGSTGDIGQGPRVVISGSLLVGSDDAGSAETRFAGGNIIAQGVVTGSFGLRGELLNTGAGIEHVASGDEKLLSVKAHTGISVNGDGVAVDVHGLTDVGSVNTSTSNQDFICVSDNSNSNATAKMGVGDLLAQTIGSVANTGTGDGQIFKTTTSREAKLKRIAAGSGVTVTNGTDDVTIAVAAPPVATYNTAGAGRLVISVDSSTIAGEESLNWSEPAGEKACLLITGSCNVRHEVTASAFTAFGAGFVGPGTGITDIPAAAVGAAGSTTHVQYNDGGDLAGSSNLVFDGTTLTAANTTNLGLQRIKTAVSTVNYTVGSTDRVVIFNTNNNVTATLPPITNANVGSVYTIKNINVGEVHVTGSSGGSEQLIDGIQYLVLSGSIAGNGPYLSLVSANTGAGYDWVVIARQLSTDPAVT